jgi:outer membrane receptor protein involved in Fe transport
MIKRLLPAFVGCLCVCSPLLAQDSDLEIFGPDQLRLGGQTDTAAALTLARPDLFSSVGGSLLLHGLPVVTLLDGRRYPISGDFGHLAPLDPIPVAFLSAVRVQTTSSPMYGSDGPGGVVDLRLNDPVTGGGEMGVFYGKSGGKYGREDFQTYIFGGVGTDKFQISAGASYESLSGHGSHARY